MIFNGKSLDRRKVRPATTVVPLRLQRREGGYVFFHRRKNTHDICNDWSITYDLLRVGHGPCHPAIGGSPWP